MSYPSQPTSITTSTVVSAASRPETPPSPGSDSVFVEYPGRKVRGGLPMPVSYPTLNHVLTPSGAVVYDRLPPPQHPHLSWPLSDAASERLESRAPSEAGSVRMYRQAGPPGLDTDEKENQLPSVSLPTEARTPSRAPTQEPSLIQVTSETAPSTTSEGTVREAPYKPFVIRPPTIVHVAPSRRLPAGDMRDSRPDVQKRRFIPSSPSVNADQPQLSIRNGEPQRIAVPATPALTVESEAVPTPQPEPPIVYVPTPSIPSTRSATPVMVVQSSRSRTPLSEWEAEYTGWADPPSTRHSRQRRARRRSFSPLPPLPPPPPAPQLVPPPPGYMSPLPLPPLRRRGSIPSPRFFFEDATYTIEVGDVLYGIHKYVVDASPVLTAKFRLDNGLRSGWDWSFTSCSLTDKCEPQEFELLLSMFYPSAFMKFEAQTVADWTTVLRLASELQMKKICTLAVDQLFPITSAVEKIELANKYPDILKDWLVPAYVELCTRTEALTLEEGKKVGVEAVVGIAQLKSQFLESVKSYVEKI